MAALVCWASGLLEVKPIKDVPPDSGPVVLMTGTAGRLTSLMTGHGQYVEQYKAFYVPGAKPIPKDENEAALVQRDNMTLVIAFGNKLRQRILKQKGRAHLIAAQRGDRDE